MEAVEVVVDSQLRRKVLDTCARHVGLRVSAYRTPLVNEVSDVLFDELIFRKVSLFFLRPLVLTPPPSPVQVVHEVDSCYVKEMSGTAPAPLIVALSL
jgi:hypothetical protein